MGEREALSAAEAAGRGVRGGGCVRLVRDEARGHVIGGSPQARMRARVDTDLVGDKIRTTHSACHEEILTRVRCPRAPVQGAARDPPGCSTRV